MFQVLQKTEEQHEVVVLNYPFTLFILHMSLYLPSEACFPFHFLRFICLTLALFNGLLTLNPLKTGEERQDTLLHNQAAEILRLMSNLAIHHAHMTWRSLYKGLMSCVMVKSIWF